LLFAHLSLSPPGLYFFGTVEIKNTHINLNIKKAYFVNIHFKTVY